MKRTLLAAAVAAAGLCLVGCDSGPKYVMVSGVVKVDGVPYKNAIVSFQPVATANNSNPGMGSTGLTDDQGRYFLKTMDGKNGAVVGQHKVRIQTKRDDPAAYATYDKNVGSPDDPSQLGVPPPGAKKAVVDPIPTDWYADTGGRDFTVPANGSDQANFDIEGVKPTKK